MKAFRLLKLSDHHNGQLVFCILQGTRLKEVKKKILHPICYSQGSRAKALPDSQMPNKNIDVLSRF